MAALAGSIGVPSAKQLAAVLALKDEVVLAEDVIKDPDNVRVPEKQAALFMMMFNAIDVIQTQDDLSKFMKFMRRTKSEELQSVFFTMAMGSKRLSPIASKNAEISKWLQDGNYQLLT
jgi:hypothetical protein